MNKNAWSADDVAEFELLVSTALAEPTVPSRRDIFTDGLDKAAKAKKFWARDILATIRDEGADRILKAEHELRRPRIRVRSADGRLLGRAPRVLGVSRRADDGRAVQQRGLFEDFTWEELRGKRAEFDAIEIGYARLVTMVDRLLELEERVPTAATPAKACEALGTTVEKYLGEAAAS